MNKVRPGRTLLFGLTMIAWTAWAPVFAPAQTPPSSFDDISSEPPPEKITMNKHFVVSNEDHLHFFYDSLKNKGGTYLGVGSEQNYILAGWAESEEILIVDFDQWIPDLHAIYAYCFSHADNPESFVALWSQSNGKAMKKELKLHFASTGRAKEFLRVFRWARPQVEKRLKKLTRQMRKADTPSFLTDEKQYKHIVQLSRSGKIHAYRADFLGKTTLRAIAETLRQQNKTIQVLYLSNIEDYFKYTPSLRENISALPGDEQSLVLRSHAHKWEGEMYFSYGVQSLALFKTWLEKPALRNMKEMIGKKRYLRNEFYRMEETP
jgi:hypothetical protein